MERWVIQQTPTRIPIDSAANCVVKHTPPLATSEVMSRLFTEVPVLMTIYYENYFHCLLLQKLRNTTFRFVLKLHLSGKRKEMHLNSREHVVLLLVNLKCADLVDRTCNFYIFWYYEDVYIFCMQ